MIFGYGLGVIASVCGIVGGIKHGFHFISVIFFVCSFFFISVTSLDRQALKLSYGIWMKASHMIGQIVTTLILSAVFILIFIPIGLFFRLIGKDYLERQIDPTAKTCWHKRKEELFKKERYQQQF